MGNLHTDHGVNQVSELVRDWNGSFSVPSVTGLENSQQSPNWSDVTRSFPNFRRSNCIYFKFPLAPCKSFISFWQRVGMSLDFVLQHWKEIPCHFNFKNGWLEVHCNWTDQSLRLSLSSKPLRFCFETLTLFSPISSVMKTSAMTYIIDRPLPIITTGA